MRQASTSAKKPSRLSCVCRSLQSGACCLNDGLAVLTRLRASTASCPTTSPTLPSDPIVATTTRGEKGDYLPNGNLLVDTRVHYVLIIKEDGSFEPAVISMSSTQVKKSRQWMSKMEGIKFKNGAGQLYTPPMFSHVYNLTTVPEKNDQGSWFGWKIETGQLLEDAQLFAAAKEFKRQISAGEIKKQTHAPPASESAGEEVPY